MILGRYIRYLVEVPQEFCFHLLLKFGNHYSGCDMIGCISNCPSETSLVHDLGGSMTAEHILDIYALLQTSLVVPFLLHMHAHTNKHCDCNPLLI